VLVVFTGQGGAGAATMTGKLYEYLGVRRPILVVGPDGPAVDLVRSAGAGVTAPPDDGPALRAALDEVMRLARDADYAGASAEVLDRFDRRTLAAEWNTVLRNVLAGSG
jgi:hypothetical protein